MREPDYGCSGAALTCNIFILFVALQNYAGSTDVLFIGWMQSLAISFALGWCLMDPLVIVIRSNIKFTKKIMKTRKYQIIEKFVVMPIGKLVGWTYATIQKFAGCNPFDCCK